MAHITKRTLKSGEHRYDVEWRTGAGRVVTETFRTRKLANARLHTIEVDKLRGVAIDPRRARVTFGAYAEGWLGRRQDLAETTRALYRDMLDRYLVPTFGELSLGAITPTDVAAWNATLRRRVPTTAAKAYRLLATIMRAAVDEDVLARTPCRFKGAATETARERSTVTVAEVEALAGAMPADMRCAVLLAAWCSLRRGEVLGLRRRDVDLLHGTVTVEQTRIRIKGGRIVTKGPKTAAGRRPVAVPPHVADELAAHLTAYVGAGPDELVFAKGHKPLRTAWDNARRSVGVDATFHDLRHTGLTWAAIAGATTAELMHRAGHRSLVAAMRYQHATLDRDRAIADAMAPLSPRAEVVELAK